ncbi:MAG: ferrochelatase [Terriglobales bacterium]
MAQGQVAVVLFQLGGPDTLEAIEPFLYNLFSDPDIIDFPFARLGRRPLAKLISATRARKVQHHYAVIGGGSPIRRFTEQQAQALETHLNEQGVEARCFVAMRYWHPLTADTVAELAREAWDDIVLLPLYPQYSSTTTGSSLNEWQRCWNETASGAKARFDGDRNGAVETAPFQSSVAAGSGGRVARFHTIRDFYTHSMYLDALVERVEQTLARFPAPQEAMLVFSAHSVPVSVIERGDPYQRHVEETVRLVMERGGWSNPHRLCYQSKVGASKWLQPSLRNTVGELGEGGVKQVCVVPVSFVSDHVETLGEIDHEAREQAGRLGIEQFEMVPGLNDSPRFIAALGDLVVQALGRVAGAKTLSEEPRLAVAG